MRRRRGDVQRAEDREEAPPTAEPRSLPLFRLAAGCLLFRLVNAAALRTSFSADEYWQSLEVAHRLVHGYGYLTWEWFAGLRGWTHPLLFAGLERVCSGLPGPLLLLAPRLLQGALFSAGDVGTYLLARALHAGVAGRETTARAALLAHLCSWLAAFAGPRTLSSSLDAPLVSLSLALWPWSGSAHAPCAPSLLLAALACVFRPPAALLFAPLALIQLVRLRGGVAPRLRLCALAAALGGCALGASTAADTALQSAQMPSTWEGGLALAPLAFFKFNLVQGGSAFFGTHPWHWYASVGLPLCLATYTPLLLLAAAAAPRSPARAQLLASMLACLCLLSLSPHKEFRFLLPLLSPACALLGAPLSRLIHPHTRHSSVLLALLLAPQVLGGLYLGRWHQAAPERAMAHLASQAAGGLVGPGGVLMLTPCHETPGYSHLRAPVPLTILDCSPPWRPGASHAVAPDGFANERDAFFAHPAAHLERRLVELKAGRDGLWAGSEPWALRVGARVPPPRGLPSHILFFDDLEEELREVVEREGYVQAERFPHAHFAVDRAQHELLLYSKS